MTTTHTYTRVTASRSRAMPTAARQEAIADFNPHYNISHPLPQRDKGGVLSWR